MTWVALVAWLTPRVTVGVALGRALEPALNAIWPKR